MKCQSITAKDLPCKKNALPGTNACSLHQEWDGDNQIPIKAKTTKKKTRGLLGSGSYGCVYRPPLRCSKKKSTTGKQKSQTREEPSDLVMKVMNHRDGEMELALSRQIRRIDPHYAYFIPLNGESCSIDSHSEELKRCIKQLRSSKSRSRSVTPLEITNLQGYFIVYGGQTLKEYVKQQHVNATTAWKWISHMITGLHKLYKAGFIHADIKYNNIVVSEKVLKLIDFGLGFSYKKEPEKVGDFLCDAKIYPAFYRAQTTRKSLNDLYAAHNVFYTMYQLKQHSPIKDPLGTYFMEAKQDPEKYRRFVWSHLEKVDLYSFFLTFFHSIWSETFFSSSIGKACWEIMYHNLHPDVEQCWTLEENLKYIESIPN